MDLKQNLLQYAEYNHWANRAITDFILNQDADLLDKVLISSFPTIRKTIFHLADAQSIWMQRMKGISPTDWPSRSAEDARALPSLMETTLEFEDFVRQLTADKLSSVCVFHALDGKEYRETFSNIIMHCMNHSTFHRGQIITMFRQAGLEGKMPRTDLIAYLREKEISL